MNYFDLHCDTVGELSKISETQREKVNLRCNAGQLDLTRAQSFSRYAQVFALFCGTQPVQSKQDAHERFVRLLTTAQQELAKNSDILLHCRTAQDLKAAQDSSKIAAFLSIEGAEILQSEEDIRAAVQAGIKIVTITWNHRSVYGCGASTNNTAGLTPAGRQLAKQLSDNGVFLDVSHVSEHGFWDLAETISAPILATHSNSKQVCPHARNLTDAQFAELMRRGGLVGINLYVPFVTQKQTADCTDVLRHIEHFCALGGERQLCIGADWDGCDRMPKGITDIRGIERLAECMAQHGYSDTLIRGIFYENANRFVQTNF